MHTDASASAVALEADLVIVGAGTAGLPAALEAADQGARVVLLDKRPEVGGMLHVSSAQFSGAGTRRQAERGIEDSPERHAREIMRLSHGLADERLVRLTTPAQREAVDWLESLGFDFHPDTPCQLYLHEPYDVPRMYFGREEGRSLLRLLERELRERVASGRVRLLLGTQVTRLVRAPGGEVTGVQACAVDGEGRPQGPLVEVRAPSVVLATGGYGASQELARRLVPEVGHTSLVACLEHATGDGLLLAEALGARLTGRGYYLPSMGFLPDPRRPGHAVAYTEAYALLIRAWREPHELWVNMRGERFVAEDVASPEVRERALMAQPHMRMAIVWDEHILQTAPPLLLPAERWSAEHIRQQARQGGLVRSAMTLEELAAQLGVDARGLALSVARYNAAVEARHDADFGRTALPSPLVRAPFYGLISQGATVLTREGLSVDEALRVLDARGEPIAGLYAVGELLGLSQFAGDTFVAGMGVGPALGLGRLLGRALGARGRAA